MTDGLSVTKLFVESYYKKKILIEKLNTPKFEILISEATVYMVSF